MSFVYSFTLYSGYSGSFPVSMDDLSETNVPLTVLGNISYQPNRKQRAESEHGDGTNGQNKRNLRRTIQIARWFGQTITQSCVER